MCAPFIGQVSMRKYLELIGSDLGVGLVALRFLQVGHHAVELLADALLLARSS